MLNHVFAYRGKSETRNQVLRIANRVQAPRSDVIGSDKLALLVAKPFHVSELSAWIEKDDLCSDEACG